MSILLVSANPLFREVIKEILPPIQSEIIELNGEEALNRICELKPEVIIIDETISTLLFEELLVKARNLQKTRTIVLNPILNEIILLDSHHKTLQKVEDLLEAIPGYELKTHPEIKKLDI